MKKTTLFEIYNLLSDKIELVTDNLYELAKLANEEEKILLTLIKKHKKLISIDSFPQFISLACDISSISNDELRNKLLSYIDVLFSHNTVITSPLFIEVLKFVSYIINYYDETVFFEIGEIDIEYVAEKMVEYFVRLFDYADDNEHSLEIILDSYEQILESIYKTTSSDNSLSRGKIYLKRLELFSSIVSNKELYLLSDDKFRLILSIAKSATSIDELSRLKKRMLLYRNSSYEEYQKILESYSSELDDESIKIIYEQLKINAVCEDGEYVITREIPNNPSEVDIVKKVLNPEKNT